MKHHIRHHSQQRQDPSLPIGIALQLLLSLSVVVCNSLQQPQLPPTVRLRGRVAYHGAAFCGFQLQKGRHEQRSVQGVLEEVLQQRLLHTTTTSTNHQRLLKVVGAGRTDAGVHARGQAFHVDVPRSCIERLQEQQDPAADHDWTTTLSTSLTRMLPNDCVVWNVGLAPPPRRKIVGNKEQEPPARLFDWNVMYDATGKWYRYRLSVAPVLDPLERHTRWRPPLSGTWKGDDFHACLQLFVGTHDFAAFTAGHPAAAGKSSLRTVYSIDCSNSTVGAIDIDFHLKGALYKQVRNMVGTAVAVGTGDMSLEQVATLLHGGEQRRADNPAAPAPPEGLTLEQVYFAEDDDAF